MPSSKKNRGKQRRAEKSRARSGDSIVREFYQNANDGEGCYFSTDELMEDVRRGGKFASENVARIIHMNTGSADSYDEFLQDGLLSVILKFLSRCDKDFAAVMNDLNGDLRSPCAWLVEVHWVSHSTWKLR